MNCLSRRPPCALFDAGLKWRQTLVVRLSMVPAGRGSSPCTVETLFQGPKTLIALSLLDQNVMIRVESDLSLSINHGGWGAYSLGIPRFAVTAPCFAAAAARTRPILRARPESGVGYAAPGSCLALAERLGADERTESCRSLAELQAL